MLYAEIIIMGIILISMLCSFRVLEMDDIHLKDCQNRIAAEFLLQERLDKLYLNQLEENLTEQEFFDQGRKYFISSKTENINSNLKKYTVIAEWEAGKGRDSMELSRMVEQRK